MPETAWNAGGGVELLFVINIERSVWKLNLLNFSVKRVD